MLAAEVEGELFRGPKEGAARNRARAWQIDACFFMAGLVGVTDFFLASIAGIPARNFDGLNNFLNCQASAINRPRAGVAFVLELGAA